MIVSGKGIPYFPVLLLMNVVITSLFQEATGQAVSSPIVQAKPLRKMNFARSVIPLSTVVTALINFALNLVVVVVFMLIYGLEPRLRWPLLRSRLCR